MNVKYKYYSIMWFMLVKYYIDVVIFFKKV